MDIAPEIESPLLQMLGSVAAAKVANFGPFRYFELKSKELRWSVDGQKVTSPIIAKYRTFRKKPRAN